LLILVSLQDLDAIFDKPSMSHVKSTLKHGLNKMERYLATSNEQLKGTMPHGQDILELWQMLEPQYPTVARMAKDLLSVPLSGVGVERNFNMGRDTCNYQQGHLHGQTIKKIMELKHAHQKEMVDELLLSEAELKKEMENLETLNEENRKQNLSEKEQLAWSCHFDYHGKVSKKGKGKGKKA
jgi:hAT family C-terminal dimerisation region